MYEVQVHEYQFHDLKSKSVSYVNKCKIVKVGNSVIISLLFAFNGWVTNSYFLNRKMGLVMRQENRELQNNSSCAIYGLILDEN